VSFILPFWTWRGAVDIFRRMIPLLIVGSFGGAFLVSAGLNWLALIPWRRSMGRHWTERARLLYPARRSARLNLFLIVVVALVTTSAMAPGLNVLVTVIPSYLGALWSGYFVSCEIFPDMTFTKWLRFIVVVAVLVFGTVLLILLIGSQMPEDFGLLTWLFAAGTLSLVLMLQFGGNVWLLKQLRLLKAAPAGLQALIREVSEKMRTPVRRAWVIDVIISNALALPATRQLVFTEKLLRTHPDEEIKAVCAHELGHLNEPRRVLLTRVAAGVSLFPLVFIRPFTSIQALGPYGFLILLVPVIVSVVVVKRLSRRMEKRADRIAIEHQADPAVYARALERLYQTNQMPAVMPSRMVRPHPDLYDRMLEAGVTPDFPKPLPPKKLSWTTYLAAAVFIGIPVFVYAILFIYDMIIGPARIQ
jgi:Zn-dependent protease with chaperone function